jgi:putative ABC transport system substrate-binding protein
LGAKLQYFDVRGPKDFEPTFRAAGKAQADAALSLLSGNIASPHRRKIAELAIESRLPAIYEQATFVEAGGLISYGVNFTDLDRRAAIYVDKILKGAKPADLPVEQPTKFELVINLNRKTDRTYGASACASESGQSNSVRGEALRLRSGQAPE